MDRYQSPYAGLLAGIHRLVGELVHAEGSSGEHSLGSPSTAVAAAKLRLFSQGDLEQQSVELDALVPTEPRITQVIRGQSYRPCLV